jgi:hypothetical protein
LSIAGAVMGIVGMPASAQSPLLRAVGIVGGVLSGICALAYVVLYFGYVKGRCFNVYASWMYYLTLILMWTECVAAFLTDAFNPVLLIFLVVFGVCNHIYFYHRRYLSYGIANSRKGEAKKHEKEEA